MNESSSCPPMGMLMVSVLSLIAFGLLAVLFGNEVSPMHWDAEVAADLYRYKADTPDLAAGGQLLALSVGGWSLAVIAVGGASFLAWKRRLWLALLCLLVVGAAPWIDEFGKSFFTRPRPAHSGLTTADSFPSGFAIRATLAFGFLGYTLATTFRLKGAKAAALGTATTLILVGSVSRIYLGRHYPTDVVAGICLGLGLLAAVIAAVEYRGRTRPAP